MANRIDRRIVSEGSKKITIYVYLEGDGSGELTNYNILEPGVDFTPIDSKVKPSILQLWYGLAWFDVSFSFDDTTPVPAWIVSRDTDAYQDFRYFGGIKDYSGLDPAKLLISTNGFAQPGSVGTLVIEIRKD
jgi:hypothetical protein